MYVKRQLFIHSPYALAPENPFPLGAGIRGASFFCAMRSADLVIRDFDMTGRLEAFNSGQI